MARTLRMLACALTVIWALAGRAAADTTPAPGAKKDDVRYLLGVGWAF